MHIPWGCWGVGRGRSTGMLSNVSRTNFMSLRLAPSTARPTGTPEASTSTLRLTPPLARSVGFFPVFFPREGGLGHAPIETQPTPIAAREVVIFRQARLPHFQAHSRGDPLLKAIVGSGAATERGRVQCLPLAAGAE